MVPVVRSFREFSRRPNPMRIPMKRIIPRGSRRPPGSLSGPGSPSSRDRRALGPDRADGGGVTGEADRMRICHYFLRIASTATMMATLTAASSRAQAPGGSLVPPERSTQAGDSVGKGAQPGAGTFPGRSGGVEVGARFPGAPGRYGSSSGKAVVAGMGPRAAASRLRGAVQQSDDLVAVRKNRVSGARRTLADLDRRIAMEAFRPVTASPSSGSTSNHLVATSQAQAPAPRPDLDAPITPAHARRADAVASPRRESAVVRAGVSRTRPSIPMPYTRSQVVGVSRALMPPPATRSTSTGYRTPPLPSRTLPAALSASTIDLP